MVLKKRRMIKMEIRIVDKYTNGRIKNVEIYKESEFCHLIDTVLKEN